MTKGPRRLVLDQYLDSATEGVIKNAGRDWARKADDLQELGEALKQAAAQAELRIGEQTLTGPALRAAMEESSGSMLTKSAQLRAAGEALRQVGQQIADTRDSRDSLADLGPKPSPYQAPPGTPGVEKTPEEIQAQADASQARQNERSAWQSQYDQQEAKSLALTKELRRGLPRRHPADEGDPRPGPDRAAAGRPVRPRTAPTSPAPRRRPSPEAVAVATGAARTTTSTSPSGTGTTATTTATTTETTTTRTTPPTRRRPPRRPPPRRRPRPPPPRRRCTPSTRARPSPAPRRTA